MTTLSSAASALRAAILADPSGALAWALWADLLEDAYGVVDDSAPVLIEPGAAGGGVDDLLAWGVAWSRVRHGLVTEVRFALAAFEELGAALFRAHPVTAVRLTCRDTEVEGAVSDSAGAPDRPFWCRKGDAQQSIDLAVYSYFLPPGLFDLLEGGEASAPEFYIVHRTYVDAAAADADLSRAAVTLGRRRAGLPALRQPATGG